jgi:hypothetical protein
MPSRPSIGRKCPVRERGSYQRSSFHRSRKALQAFSRITVSRSSHKGSCAFPHSSGAIGWGSAPLMARSQSAKRSSRWISIQACTKRIEANDNSEEHGDDRHVRFLPDSSQKLEWANPHSDEIGDLKKHLENPLNSTSPRGFLGTASDGRMREHVSSPFTNLPLSTGPNQDLRGIRPRHGRSARGGCRQALGPAYHRRKPPCRAAPTRRWTARHRSSRRPGRTSPACSSLAFLKSAINHWIGTLPRQGSSKVKYCRIWRSSDCYVIVITGGEP